MNSSELREKFLKFFEEKGHKIVPSSSLIPDDPSVLLTTSGMQQFKKYFTGELEFEKQYKGAVSIQKCFRTSDIDEVGDESHLTFFEMLGHFSFGGYYKKETIEWTHELLTKVFNLPLEKISVTVFEGDGTIPFDNESYETWSKFLPEKQIRKGKRADNVWGPVGAEGPCGACIEVYFGDLEIATLVFMEYYCNPDKSLTSLTQKGVDVGWGLERLTTAVQSVKNVYEIDTSSATISILPPGLPIRSKRILADHGRAVSFLISDGVRPSNKGAGYILRRLLRRMIVHGKDLEILLSKVVTLYKEAYPELNEDIIISEFQKENEKFQKTLKGGLKELNKLETIDAQSAFKLFETYGLPYEVIKELGGQKAEALRREEFESEFKKHQEISRAGLEKKFGGHGLLLDTGELKAVDERELKIVTRLHTATHLMQAALREVLGPEVKQNGSDITAERTRFDFFFPRKVTPEELEKVEGLVNEKIKEDLPVSFIEMPIEEAKKTGALYFFKAKYGDKVKIYFMGKDLDTAFSKEFCGGPHVAYTAEVGKFKIMKEESAAASIRRIRATIE